jgi:site-specific DNA-methyltransferase (adenine-specific)
VRTYFSDAGIAIYAGDCLDVMPTLEAGSVDAIVTDPPYGIKFMGKDWDHGVPGVHFWSEALRLAKPGAHLLAFGGTRTSHRLVCAIEDAGWEIRDTIMWVYGSGFPKSRAIAKDFDNRLRAVVGEQKAPGHALENVRQGAQSRTHTTFPKYDAAPITEEAHRWQGWGTALKPAVEPICLARKPLVGTVAANVQRYGTGALNIDASRIPTEPNPKNGVASPGMRESRSDFGGGMRTDYSPLGRWPANLIHDGSEEVLKCFPESEARPVRPENIGHNRDGVKMGLFGNGGGSSGGYSDLETSASRFFYCAKASKADRYSEAGNDHPTVKPESLLRYLIRLITPPGGLVLDPFLGSGTTSKAAQSLGFRCIGIDLEERHCEIAVKRLSQGALDLGGA